MHSYKIINVVIPLLTLFIASCSTLPSGEKILSKKVEEDQERSQTQSKTDFYQGRPIFAKVKAYPQAMPNGDVFLGGNLLLIIGHEKLTLEEMTK